MQIIEIWFSEHSLSVNLTKTEMVLFTERKRRFEGSKNIEYIPSSEHVKYLGVIFDNKMKQDKHLETPVQKARRVF